MLLLQPRRVAARAMARRIAEERNWTVGREIGWHIRFERNFTNDTRLLVVTEGILTAYLQQDPLLSDVATIIIDEFHERSVHADLGLALAKQAWLARSDLRIVVMSATLDPEPVSAFLGGCAIISVPGSLHPLAVEYAPGETIGGALGALLPRTTGNILCFLPGAREITTAIADSESIARAHDVDLVPLHGSLDSGAQDAALSPSSPRRRVIVATNIAETSLTVSGVTTVIDSGLHKVARYDESRAIDSLNTERITMDSADQRAGRAARLGPGIARRLWDARDRLRPHREPEIHRVDLTGLLLSVLAWGTRPDSFEWFDPPSPERVAAAMSLLQQLGATDARGLTEIGRQMQRLPLSPRLARVLIAGRGSFEACAACARLSEPSFAKAPEGRPATVDLRQVEQNLARAAKSVLGDRYRAHISDTELQHALLAGYPDRVAKRRDRDTVTLASGHGAVITKNSGADNAGWMIALDVTSGRKTATTQALLRLASPIEPRWLTATHAETVHELDSTTGAVRALEVDWYHALALREHPIAPDEERRAEMLAAAWLDRGPDEDSRHFLRRISFAGLAVEVKDLALQAARSARRLSDMTLTDQLLAWDARHRLEKDAPLRLKVPSGRDMPIEYGDDGSAAVSVKLQELFGLAESPRIGPARTPITFHLLAPNGRPVQTTQDLKSFWERTYPEVRKELRGRYPRHPWPEDPWNAPPTHRTTKRSSQ